MIEADEMRQRFDRAYAARIAQKRKIQLGRGVWLSLYDEESTNPVYHVGAGAGLDHPAIDRVPLTPEVPNSSVIAPSKNVEQLSVPDAIRRLAMTLGVDPSNIKITIEA